MACQQSHVRQCLAASPAVVVKLWAAQTLMVRSCRASYKLRDMLGQRARRYEKGSVGGRLKSLHIGDHPFELGGSMVYEGNQYIRRAAARHLAGHNRLLLCGILETAVIVG